MSQFDSAAWNSGAGNYDGKNPRADMVEAAQNAGVRAGADRDRIRAMLGKPDSTGPTVDIWYLGRDTLSVDFRTLRVDYDDRNHATDVREGVKAG